MDQKTWLWRKSLSEKKNAENGRTLGSSQCNNKVKFVIDKAKEVESSVSHLNVKLSSMHSNYSAKDDIVAKHVEVAEEAIAGWEIAEAEALFLKRDLDEVLQQRAAAGERISNLDGALKECMQQLRVTRADEEQRIHGAVMKASREYEKERMLLEEKLAETSKKLANLGMENSHLCKNLQTKDKMIEKLSQSQSQAEADVNALIARLNSNEKDTASLKYNIHLLEKELDIQLKERELSLKSADASRKEHVDSMKKISKLEKECNRLHLLVQKRLPFAAAFPKMESKVKKPGKESDERRMVNLTSATDLMVDSPRRRINSLIEQLCATKEENKTLKETINKKDNELQSLRTLGLQVELARSTMSHDLPMASASEVGYEDEVSCAGSWASSLLSELEHIRSGKTKGPSSCTTLAVTDISLMDDFVEVEKLAKASEDRTFVSSDLPSHKGVIHMGHSELESCVHATEVSGSTDGSKKCSCLTCKPPNEVPSANSFHTNFSSDEISMCTFQSDVLTKSIHRIIELIEVIYQTSLKDHKFQILSEKSPTSIPFHNSASSTDYTVRVFQWKTSELGDVLQRFVHTCNDLLNGKADPGNFAEELSSSLDWISNHCFSVQDVSSMRDKIKKHFDCDESQSGSEFEDLMNCSPPEAERAQIPEEKSCSSYCASLNGQSNFSEVEEVHSSPKAESWRLKQKLTNMESVQKDLEGKLQLATEQTETMMIQLRELEERFRSLQVELETTKESKGMMEGQIKDQKLLNEDLDGQLKVMRDEQNEVRQKCHSLEVELENKINSCQESEATCLRLQLQLDSLTKRAVPKYEDRQESRQLQTNWEIPAASEKLAECQETILSLGKQLKQLASPRQDVFVDKVVSTIPTSASKNKNLNRRSSLLNQMLAEDNAETDNFKSPETKEIICTNVSSLTPLTSLSGISDSLCGLDSQVKKSQELVVCSNELKYKGKAATGKTLAVVYNTRCGAGVSLMRKLILRRSKSGRKKALTMAT